MEALLRVVFGGSRGHESRRTAVGVLNPLRERLNMVEADTTGLDLVFGLHFADPGILSFSSP